MANAAPRRANAGAWLAAALAAGFAVAGVGVPFYGARIFDKIQHSSRFEPDLALGQIGRMMAKLQAAAALASLDPSPARLKQVRIDLGIVKSRMGEFRSGQLGARIANDRKRLIHVATIERAVEALTAGLVAEAPAHLGVAFDEIIKPTERPLIELGAATIADSAALAASDEAEVGVSQRIQTFMLMGVVLSGFWLIVRVLLQNARLQLAHAEQARMTKEFAYIANHDSLTGLFNRSGFAACVAEACGRAREGRARFALLTLDLDKFKTINDVFGHAAGDMMLVSVAQRLARLHNPHGAISLARLGGDEFSVLVEGGAAAAARVADAILALLKTPHQIGPVRVGTAASIGVALVPDHGVEASDLMLASDIALYGAKASGRGVVRVFQRSVNQQGLSRATLEARLGAAVASGEIVPFYQPQVELSTGRIVGVEALMRWRCNGIVVPPAEFLPFAEATGLIVALERELLRVVCADLPRLPGHIKVSFNVSAAQLLCADSAEDLLVPVRAAGADPRRLEVEITETVLLANVERVAAFMASLQGAGVTVALDDFGSGYSSLGYLQKIPFDKIKIDKMFVDGLAETSQAFAILETIAALGRTLNQTVIAEGVETREQVRLVERAGCHLMQGYLVSKPLPLDALLSLMEAREAALRPALSA